jgi:hypothetical protein
VDALPAVRRQRARDDQRTSLAVSKPLRRLPRRVPGCVRSHPVPVCSWRRSPSSSLALAF